MKSLTTQTFHWLFSYYFYSFKCKLLKKEKSVSSLMKRLRNQIKCAWGKINVLCISIFSTRNSKSTKGILKKQTNKNLFLFLLFSFVQIFFFLCYLPDFCILRRTLEFIITDITLQLLEKERRDGKNNDLFLSGDFSSVGDITIAFQCFPST